MDSRPLVVITTRLPPEVCGIGTYSWLLHRHWPDRSRDVLFLVVDGAAKSIRDLNHAGISDFGLNSRRLACELGRIGSADILLHYAGRAFHRYGCPSWLPPVLVEWKRKFPAGRLMILFHELPGDFPITSLHYWIDMCNRRVIRKLARSADIFVTNTAEHARKLERPSGRSNIPWFPVPSNIPAESNDLSGRARTEFVIFGLPFGRWQTLQMFDKDIRSWLETDRLTKLHIVGPRDERLDACSDDLIARWRNPNIVHHHGVLPPIEVSKLLSRAQFGLVNATIENWSKSAVFMALAAHGCAVVTRAKSKTVPLRFTVAPAEVATIDDVDLGERTRALQEWYETHADWNVVARKISSLLPARMGTGALP